MIIVLSPSSQILFSWMSNWPHWEIIYSALAAPAVPREVILSTCLHFSAVLPLKLLALQSFAWRKSLTFVWLSVPGGVSSALIWEWFHGTLLACWVFFIWLPQITGAPCSCDCSTPGPQSLFRSPLMWSSHSRAHSFARRLFDCPSQEDSSLSFIWLNYYAGFVEGVGDEWHFT